MLKHTTIVLAVLLASTMAADARPGDCLDRAAARKIWPSSYLNYDRRGGKRCWYKPKSAVPIEPPKAEAEPPPVLPSPVAPSQVTAETSQSAAEMVALAGALQRVAADRALAMTMASLIEEPSPMAGHFQPEPSRQVWPEIAVGMLVALLLIDTIVHLTTIRIRNKGAL